MGILARWRDPSDPALDAVDATFGEPFAWVDCLGAFPTKRLRNCSLFMVTMRSCAVSARVQRIANGEEYLA